MTKTIALILTLAACGGTDQDAQPDSAGTTTAIQRSCAEFDFSNDLLAGAIEPCPFDMTGLDWTPSGGVPLVLNLAGRSAVIDYLGMETYRSDLAFRWTGDATSFGVALALDSQTDRCAWVRCLR